MTAMCGRTTRSVSSSAWFASMAASAGGGVYADCGGNVVEMFKILKAAKAAYSDVLA